MCSSIEDVLESNESSINHFYGKNIIICVALSIPESFSNNDNDNNKDSIYFSTWQQHILASIHIIV